MVIWIILILISLHVILFVFNICKNAPLQQQNMQLFLAFLKVSFVEVPRSVFQEIQLLHAVYTNIDRLAINSGIHKLETIGNIYVGYCESGKGSGEKMLKFCQDAAQIYKVIIGSHYILKMGLSFGEITYGVLSNIKPKNCVVGDPINVCARLCALADPGTLLCQRDIVPDNLNLRHREIYAKGKGVRFCAVSSPFENVFKMKKNLLMLFFCQLLFFT